MAGFYVAIFSRLTRSAMLEVSRQDYVRTAWAKGVGPVAVNLRHILRNALIPVTTVAGLHFGTLLGGAVVLEVVFSWPGLGRLALERSEEHTSELQSLMRISYAVFCLKKKKNLNT